MQGCNENLDRFESIHIPEWSAVRERRYGFGILNIVNATHLVYEQKDEKVLDGKQLVNEFDELFFFSEQHYRLGDDCPKSPWAFRQLAYFVYLSLHYVNKCFQPAKAAKDAPFTCCQGIHFNAEHHLPFDGMVRERG